MNEHDGGTAPDASGSVEAHSRSPGTRRKAFRWRHYFPVLRCPYCRRWLKLEERAEYKFRGATKDEIKEAGLE